MMPRRGRAAKSRLLEVILVFIISLSILLFLGHEYIQTKEALLKIQFEFDRHVSRRKMYAENNENVDKTNVLYQSKIGLMEKGMENDRLERILHKRSDNRLKEAIPVDDKPDEEKLKVMALDVRKNKQAIKDGDKVSHRLILNPKKIRLGKKGGEKESNPTLTKNQNDKRPAPVKRKIISFYNLTDCPEKPESLLGNISVNTNLDTPEPKELNRVFFGGWWSPEHCKPRVKVAVIVPLRNRPKQLRVFLRHMTPILQRQLLYYRIFVVEQIGTTPFNKGVIYNIGFNTSLLYDDFDCFIFHDVDLLMENDHNYYGCPASPLHMSVAIDKFKYKLPYKALFGGIQAFTREHFLLVNGYSTKYWGWGAEDDDLYKRVKDAKLTPQRPNATIARYKMNNDGHFVKRMDYSLWEARNKGMLKFHPLNRQKEGLNQTTIIYTKNIVEYKLYTHISIDISFNEGDG